ncbi:MAG TPA: hypothetical protein VL989_02275 [Candidatus Sulfotelmatobacter sp.]|nr:hypothetical protein [Candidatus Sulfotelmatobacter sp.]
MFFHFPLERILDLRQTVLLLNTVLLIAALIVVELVYSEAKPKKRKELKYFFPLFLVLTGLLIYAFYVQRSVL